jgi:hypothetical protein
MPRHEEQGEPRSPAADGEPRWRRFLPHLAGLAWVVAAAGAVLAPALAHGTSLGPFDLLSRYGLSAHPGVRVHYTGPGDQIEVMIPWTSLAWTQVHHGHLPLWNPYSGLGMPLAFNWQSSVFSVPSLVGYLFPLSLAYTAALVTTLVIAGTGVYVLGRLLGLGWIGCVTAATAYELSGPLTGWLGWPNAAALAWAGWLFAAGLLVLRRRRRVAGIALFAVVLACAVYAGMPEAVVFLAFAFVLFAVVLLAIARFRDRSAPLLRPIGDLALAGVAGAALSAPLALPGAQVVSASVARAVQSYGTLRPHDLLHIVFQGFDGLPVAGSRWFGPSIYPETAAYVGVIALVLAVCGFVVRRRHPEIQALAAVAVVMGIAAFAAPLARFVTDVTGVRAVAWHRAVLEMAFALALLAGVGADVVVRQWRDPVVRRCLGGGFAAVAVFLAAVWLVGRGTLPPAEAALRARSFLWPVGLAALGLATTVVLTVAARHKGPRHRTGQRRHLDAGAWMAGALLAGETAFLVAAGAPLVSSNPSFWTPTPAEAALHRAVGTSVVAFGTQACHTPPTLGILPDFNVAEGIHELAVYDPMIPRELFRSWQSLTGRPATTVGAPLVFCPAITTAALARQYGASFVLEPAGARPPSGTTLAGHVGDEDLYRVPGAAEAVEVPIGMGGASSSAPTAGIALRVTHPTPASWQVTTTGASAALLRLHLLATPGWHAAIDGRPLALSSVGGMLEARVPAGRHTVALDYRPAAFTAGLVLAVLSALALATGAVWTWRRRHRRAADRPSPPALEPAVAAQGRAYAQGS